MRVVYVCANNTNTTQPPWAWVRRVLPERDDVGPYACQVLLTVRGGRGAQVRRVLGDDPLDDVHLLQGELHRVQVLRLTGDVRRPELSTGERRYVSDRVYWDPYGFT